MSEGKYKKLRKFTPLTRRGIYQIIFTTFCKKINFNLISLIKWLQQCIYWQKFTCTQIVTQPSWSTNFSLLKFVCPGIRVKNKFKASFRNLIEQCVLKYTPINIQRATNPRKTLNDFYCFPGMSLSISSSSPDCQITHGDYKVLALFLSKSHVGIQTWSLHL